ncbi:MAG: CvpA family protein [Bacteroidales bacterium]|nr:CvpA family protein [Bacteroidales bacterium]HOY37775.1 CvpA family protein [Bacteroidales bacterium]HQP02962.1 CvpA family protein [Bacteroidales bacterium]
MKNDTMNVLDIIIIIPLVWFGFKGLKNGLIKEAGSVAALVLGIFGALEFSGFTEKYVHNFTSVSAQYIPLIAFAVTFVAILIVVYLISGLLDKFVNAVKLGWLNKLGGIVFGVLKIAFIISALFYMLHQVNTQKKWISESYLNTSLLYKPIAAIIPTVYPYIPDIEINKHEQTKEDEKK